MAGQPYKLNVTTEVEDPNLTAPPKFWWCLWFNGVEALPEFVPRVREVWMVRLTCDNPGFWFQVEDGSQFLATFCDSARGGVTGAASASRSTGSIEAPPPSRLRPRAFAGQFLCQSTTLRPHGTDDRQGGTPNDEKTAKSLNVFGGVEGTQGLGGFGQCPPIRRGALRVS